MEGDLPRGDKAVARFLDYIALGFALGFAETLIAGKPWYIWLSSLFLGILVYLVALRWEQVRPKIGTGLATSLEHFASSDRAQRLFVYGLFCGVLFSILLQMRSQRIDLDTYAMPRRLTHEQAESVGDYLRSLHDPHDVVVRVDRHDVEAYDYAGQLSNAIQSAGWTTSIREYAEGEPALFSDPGIAIRSQGTKGIAVQEAIQKLNSAFAVAELEEDISAGGSVPGEGEYKVLLLVGRRPLMIGPARRGPLFYRVGRRIINRVNEILIKQAQP